MQLLRTFDTNQLVVLDIVLRERSVRRAAAALHVTPSAVSHVLAELRRRLDDPLVVRQRGALVPTPFALQLAAPLRAGLDQLELALSHKRDFDPATATVSFTLAAADLVEFVVLPGLLAKITRTAPSLKLRVVTPEADAFAQIDAGGTDLVTGLFASAPAGYRFQALFDDGYALVVRRRHPLLRGRMTARRLAEAPHVIVDPRGSHNRTRVDVALAERGVSRRIVAAVPHFFAALHAIARSDLVGFLPTRIAATSDEVEIVASPVAIPRFTVGQVWAERVQRDPAHRWFRDEVRAAARIARAP